MRRKHRDQGTAGREEEASEEEGVQGHEKIVKDFIRELRQYKEFTGGITEERRDLQVVCSRQVHVPSMCITWRKKRKKMYANEGYIKLTRQAYYFESDIA